MKEGQQTRTTDERLIERQIDRAPLCVGEVENLEQLGFTQASVAHVDERQQRADCAVGHGARVLELLLHSLKDLVEQGRHAVGLEIPRNASVELLERAKDAQLLEHRAQKQRVLAHAARDETLALLGRERLARVARELSHELESLVGREWRHAHRGPRWSLLPYDRQRRARKRRHHEAHAVWHLLRQPRELARNEARRTGRRVIQLVQGVEHEYQASRLPTGRGEPLGELLDHAMEIRRQALAIELPVLGDLLDDAAQHLAEVGTLGRAANVMCDHERTAVLLLQLLHKVAHEARLAATRFTEHHQGVGVVAGAVHVLM